MLGSETSEPLPRATVSLFDQRDLTQRNREWLYSLENFFEYGIRAGSVARMNDRHVGRLLSRFLNAVTNQTSISGTFDKYMLAWRRVDGRNESVIVYLPLPSNRLSS